MHHLTVTGSGLASSPWRPLPLSKALAAWRPRDSMLLCAADALIWPPILIQPNCASAGAGSDSDSDYASEAGHPGHIIWCMPGLIMILSLIPHRPHRRSTGSRVHAPMVRTLEQCRDTLYQHAGRGLWPLSWDRPRQGRRSHCQADRDAGPGRFQGRAGAWRSHGALCDPHVEHSRADDMVEASIGHPACPHVCGTET